MASTVGAKNPYRYRGYRYDGETGLYYLNARYYNAEWGRFINADAYGGNVGDLLSHNMFAYCMNNPVNMSDPSGNWPSFSGNWPSFSGNWPSFSGIIKAAKSVVKNIVKTVVTVVVKASTAVVKSVKSTVSRIMNNPYLKGSTSGGIDKAGEHAAKKYISKTTRGFVSTGKLTIQKYVTTPGAAARAAKFTAKKVGVGSVIFTGIDMYESASDKKYVGAGINFLAGAIGVGAGMILGAVGGIAISFGLPVLAVGAGVFVAGVVVGVFIDKGANAITDWYYRRKEKNGS
ncbi:RHS repeat-associated core domain-containing protein [Clostridium pasteurianum]|uniref:RHS repeat-associated core domain-containing protein n=1 Tax=Clostridium pasteurianum TaxID=1501 RepID=UPI001F3ED720|nr:RHS repeat-associated core domain-containing protein [Clostridium pasteurianum]